MVFNRPILVQMVPAAQSVMEASTFKWHRLAHMPLPQKSCGPHKELAGLQFVYAGRSRPAGSWQVALPVVGLK